MAFRRIIECDGCSFYMDYSNHVNIKIMTEDARKKGWSIGKWHLCPTCKNDKEIKKMLKEYEQKHNLN